MLEFLPQQKSGKILFCKQAQVKQSAGSCACFVSCSITDEKTSLNCLIYHLSVNDHFYHIPWIEFYKLKISYNKPIFL